MSTRRHGSPHGRSNVGISRRYLHDEVAERLRELIRSGELEPRARVNELELAERFGISRTPLREAIKILATEGLLELLPNRGARVASLSSEEIDEMIEVVAGLEATAADLACRAITRRGDRRDRGEARGDAEGVEAARTTEPISRSTARSTRRSCRPSRNATLQGIYAKLSGRIQRARYSAHKTPEQWQRAVDEHERDAAAPQGAGRRAPRRRDARAYPRQEAGHRRGLRIGRNYPRPIRGRAGMAPAQAATAS